MKLDSTGQFQTLSKAVVTASYAVSLRVVKTKKTHNIAETLMKPCLVKCAGILLGEGPKSKAKQVSLSTATVKPRIADMTCDVKSEFHRYFRRVQHYTPMMALTRNPFRVSVEGFPNEQNQGEGIQKRFWIWFMIKLSRLPLQIKASKN